MTLSVGDPFVFRPHVIDTRITRARKVSGRIVYVNRRHHYFLAVATIGYGYEYRECFKF